jgi:hypothetical protein
MAFNPGQFVETLRLFIEHNSKDIFAFVENNRRPMELGSENQLFGRLMRELVSTFPHCHCENGPIAGHAEPDKAHYELAIAILEVFWCGCLTQMKENRIAYTARTTDAIRSIITNTFDIARAYGPQEEERRRLQTNPR